MKQHKKEVQLAELGRSPRKVSFNRLSPISSKCCDEKELPWTTHIFWSKFPEGLSIGVPSHTSSRKNRDPGGVFRGSILVFRGVSQQSWLPKKTIYCQPSVHRFHFVGQWVLPDLTPGDIRFLRFQNDLSPSRAEPFQRCPYQSLRLLAVGAPGESLSSSLHHSPWQRQKWWKSKNSVSHKMSHWVLRESQGSRFQIGFMMLDVCLYVWMSASSIMFDCQTVDHISFAVELLSPHVWLV